MKTLNDKELSRIKLDDLNVQIVEELVKNSILKIKNMEFQQRILSLEMLQEKNNLESARLKLTSVKMERAENLKLLAKKKNLKEGWGFNPDSGEIVED